MSNLPLDSRGDDTVYLDHAATAPMRSGVWEAMAATLGEADLNPSSPHGFGQRSRRHLEEARSTLARLLDAPKSTLHFTGGGTQSDNLAVLGFARARLEDGEVPRVLISAVEHEAVRASGARAGREGARVETVPVDGEGQVRLDELRRHLEAGHDGPTLVSVMWANNEVGTVQPVGEVAELVHRHDALLHVDAVQALGKCPVSLEDVPADLLTVTAHKLGGPVGIGLLHVSEGVELAPLTYGGAQEGGLWPGTQNPLASVGFAEAARLMVEALPASARRWSDLRDELAERLQGGIPDLRFHGAGAARRLPNLLSVGIPGCDSSSLLVSLDLEGVAASSGSACSSGSSSPSHVLDAMGVLDDVPEDYAVLRLSLGPGTHEDDVERAADAVVRVAGRLRSGSAARA